MEHDGAVMHLLRRINRVLAAGGVDEENRILADAVEKYDFLSMYAIGPIDDDSKRVFSNLLKVDENRMYAYVCFHGIGGFNCCLLAFSSDDGGGNITAFTYPFYTSSNTAFQCKDFFENHVGQLKSEVVIKANVGQRDLNVMDSREKARKIHSIVEFSFSVSDIRNFRICFDKNEGSEYVPGSFAELPPLPVPISFADLRKEFKLVYRVFPLEYSVGDNKESVRIFEYVFGREGKVYMCFREDSRVVASEANCALIQLPFDTVSNGQSYTCKFFGVQGQANLFKHQREYCDSGTIQTLVRKAEAGKCIKFYMDNEFSIQFYL